MPAAGLTRVGEGQPTMPPQGIRRAWRGPSSVEGRDIVHRADSDAD